MGEKRHRECVGVIVGTMADVEPTVGNDLNDMLSRTTMTIADVAQASEIPISVVINLVSGQGKLSTKWCVKLARLFQVSEKHVRSAFYLGCRRAAKNNPDLVMYPRQGGKTINHPGNEMLTNTCPVIDFRQTNETILQLGDGNFYKLTIQKIGCGNQDSNPAK